jgi:hypothetical protein
MLEISPKEHNMPSRYLVFVLLIWISFVAGCAPPQAPPAPSTPSTSAPQVAGNMAQLMRGILFPASNVIFEAQNQNPDEVKPADDPSTAVNPLQSSFGKWQAVENAALALSESANLLSIPGRKCQNGRDVPINNPDWPMLVQGLRDAGATVYKAAQTKNQDNIVMAAETMTTACAACHDKYREKPNLADRCM